MSDSENILLELERILQNGLDALQQIEDEAQLGGWRTAHLGRNAPVMQVFARMGSIPKELRQQVGQKANQVKTALESALEQRAEVLRREALERKLTAERLDVTLPGRPPALGRAHPATQALD